MNSLKTHPFLKEIWYVWIPFLKFYSSHRYYELNMKFKTRNLTFLSKYLTLLTGALTPRPCHRRINNCYS